MKKIAALILCAVVLLTLASCGGEMPAKTPEPATPEAVTPEKTPEPEESYPKQVKYRAGWVNPALILPGTWEAPNVQIVCDRETMEEYRAKYDEITLNDLLYLCQYPELAERTYAGMLTEYANAVKAFRLCEEGEFFEENALILIGVSYSGNIERDRDITCSIIRDENNEEKLFVQVNGYQKGVFPGLDGDVPYTIVLAVSKETAKTYQNDIVLEYTRTFTNV